MSPQCGRVLFPISMFQAFRVSVAFHWCKCSLLSFVIFTGFCEFSCSNALIPSSRNTHRIWVDVIVCVPGTREGNNCTVRPIWRRSTPHVHVSSRPFPRKGRADPYPTSFPLDLDAPTSRILKCCPFNSSIICIDVVEFYSPCWTGHHHRSFRLQDPCGGMS